MEEQASTSSGINIEAISSLRRPIYYNLRRIFPHVNPIYIKEIILNPPFRISTTVDNEKLTNDLADHLIDFGNHHINVNALTKSQNYFQVNTTSDIIYDRLSGIFPDADPEYLRGYSNNFYNQLKKINDFIETNLETKLYPTREQYVKRKKMEEQFCKYFTKFNVEDFLKTYADPFEYFEGEHRICSENATVYNLLCQGFLNLHVEYVSNEYKTCKFNPSLTVRSLERKGSKFSLDFSNENLKKIENEIAEFAFICNKEKIQQYVEQKKEEERIALKNSRQNNELIECECCLSEFVASNCSTCEEGHIFCNECIVDGTKESIAKSNYIIECFQRCNAVFNLKTLEKVLSSKLYSLLIKKQQEAELAAVNFKDLENCPFCNVESINEDKKIFKCLNDGCLRESCRRCKKENHLPYDCDDVLEISKARLYLEEKMTKALIRICPKCKRQFVKEHGCNLMICECKVALCYLCDELLPSASYKHFNGQGANRHDLCPLFSDDKFLEAQAVRTVAQSTIEEIKKRNPEIKLEIPEGLLPILPPKTAGAHDDIPNSDQLPEHAIRVAKAIPP